MNIKNIFLTLILSAVFLFFAACSKPAGAASIPEPEPTKTYISNYTENSSFTITASYTTGFETLSDFSGFYIVPQNHMSTASHDMTAAAKHSGIFSNYGWIYGANTPVAYTNTNHRGYPTIQLHKTPDGSYQGLVFCEFWVKLNIPLENVTDKDWFSFATFSTYSDDNWYRCVLVNLDSQGIVRLMHVPNTSEGVCDIFQTSTVTFPQNQWVKLTVLLDFTSSNQYSSAYAKVWQDGILVSAARFNPRANPNSTPSGWWPACLSTWGGTDIAEAESLCGLVYTGGLAQAHFGLYAAPLLASGEVWNDDLTILELTR